MAILVTSSRMPFALDEIRKLGKEGHRVVASDTFKTAPGSHSRYVAVAKVTASPRYDTGVFVQDVARIVREEAVDLVLPAFEEAFYLARHRDAIGAPLFTPPFETMARLHDKVTTLELARAIGVPAPRTLVAQSREELRAATRELGAYFARPSFSRGGVQLLTNRGPLAGAIDLEACQPTAQNPFVVQEFVQGKDICTFSIAQHGKLTAHATYLHPREIEHAGGIVFESIVDDEGMRYVQQLVEATGYHGQVSFDFLRTAEGLVLVECNPRPTAGVMMLSPPAFAAALLDERARHLRIAEAGICKKYSIALVRDMVMHWREAPEDIRQLLSKAREFYAEPGDVLPALYTMLSYSHVLVYRKFLHRASDPRQLMAAYFHDLLWDGEPIA
jgi:glutathione synthase/RimK-type ligase-like ATP-grasp enzyme